MKKILFVLLLLIFVFFLTKPIMGWDDCPKGLVNDPYPGSCGQYIDTNNNGICDHSEPEPGIVGEVGKVEEVDKVGYTDQSNTSTKSNPMYFWIPLVVYSIHWFLSHRTKIAKKYRAFSLSNFRLVWNIALFVSFLPVGISGMMIYSGIKGQNFLFWHNQVGTIMTVVAFLHFLYRLSYFKSLLKNKII